VGVERQRIVSVLDHYNLGQLVDYERDERGFVNTSYVIHTIHQGERRGYLLRRYRKGTREEEVIFEHSIIQHLVNAGFPLVAKVLPTKADRRYVGLPEGEEFGDRSLAFYAIFELLSGEDRFTWVDPVCSPEELSTSAAVQAQFHHQIHGFMPEGQKDEPGILELLPRISERLRRYATRTPHTVFDRFFLKHRSFLIDVAERTRDSLLTMGADKLNRCVIHCDYHPGNLKFKGGHVVGLFDFDWSKVDLRSFDVALALFYFCTGWKGEADGVLRLDEVKLFIHAYQETLRGKAGLGPLSPRELVTIPVMVQAANLYVLNWVVEDYDHGQVDPAAYVRYLRHGVSTGRWLQWPGSQDALTRLCQRQIDLL
jgi:homoserine kinase type II